LRICVANPPAYLYNDTRHFIQSGSRWSFSMDAPKGNHKFPHYQPFPFSLAYASAIWKACKNDVLAFDACALDMDEHEFIDTVNKWEPEYLVLEVPVISSTLVLKMLENLNCKIKTVLTGPISILNTAQRYKYRVMNGQWDASIALRYDDFSVFPFPDRTSFPNEQYSNFETERPSAQMLTSRGCPHNCIFCLERHVTYGSPVVVFRKPENVVDEMVQLQQDGVKHIYFDDMSITSSREHIEGICEEILTRRLDIPWTCMGDLLVREITVKSMAQAGCKGLAFGVETLTGDALNNISKKFINEEKVKSFIKLLKDNDIWSHATYSIGLPGETYESIMKTIDFAINARSDSLQFSIATPYPGTPFYNMCKDNGWLITDDFTRYDGARFSVVDYPNLKHEQIEELFRHAMERREELGLKFRK